MLNPNYGSPYFWDKVVLTKFISGCRMVWDLICGTSCFYKSKTEKVTGGGKSAILPNWCCLLSIRVLFTHPLIYLQKYKSNLVISLFFIHFLPHFFFIFLFFFTFCLQLLTSYFFFFYLLLFFLISFYILGNPYIHRHR